jgi:hypothetical protein
MGFDTAGFVSADQAKRFRAAGYKFVMRYVERSQRVYDEPTPTIGDWFYPLSKKEFAWLLDADLMVGVVQRAKFRGKPYLNRQYGKDIGYAAMWCCKELGVPQGATVYVDAEWTDGPSDSQVMQFLRAWHETGPDAKMRTGTYEGYEGLTGAQWYSIPYCRSYWRSALRYLGDPQPRSWSMYQTTQQAVFGIGIDVDLITYDNKGNRPYLVAA